MRYISPDGRAAGAGRSAARCGDEKSARLSGRGRRPDRMASDSTEASRLPCDQGLH